MKSQSNNTNSETDSAPTHQSGRLFLFTDEDEERIACAIEESKIFMQSYGKGAMICPIDLKHYII